jgi:phosphatidylglycerol:prolipoprotein diacylglycerol transferase
MLALAYPAIDPVIVEIGPLAVRWYGLAYLTGILLGWWVMRRLCARSPAGATPDDVGDFVFWAVVGVVVGGRLGSVLFYQFDYYAANPLQVFAIWKGGMAFHGGLIGVIAATILFCRRRKIALLAFGDMIACVAPIGLFFGRIANFINGELFGRPAPDVPWAMAFPRGGPVPRHPSQLYEAALEGLLLFLVLMALWRLTRVRETPGTLIGVFLIGYGAARSIVELFREPDAHLGLLSLGLTMGQWLSLPMIAAGVGFVLWSRRARRA